MKYTYESKCRILYLLILLLTAVLLNIYIPKLFSLYYNKTFLSAEHNDSKKFEYLLRNTAYRTLEKETWNVSLSEVNTLWYYFSPKVSVFDYGEYGLLMHYSYLYGQTKGDTEICMLVKKKFDNWLMCYAEGVRRIDQSTYGLVALDLWLTTNDDRYKECADNIYERLDSLDKVDGIVMYNRKSDQQRVDGIGLVCPFLYTYSLVFNHSYSKEIADRMVLSYMKYGVDPETGVPAKAYGQKNHIKHISPNWGRGVSWYLIGINKMDKADDLVSSYCERLDSVLLSDKDHIYQQYLGEEGLPDMTTTIPILWHLVDCRKLYLSKDELTKLISPYCDSKGVVRYCSGLVSSKKGVELGMTNIFVQGLLLYMYSQMK